MSNFSIDPSYQEVAERMKLARELWPNCIFRAANPEKAFPCSRGSGYDLHNLYGRLIPGRLGRKAGYRNRLGRSTGTDALYERLRAYERGDLSLG